VFEVISNQKMEKKEKEKTKQKPKKAPGRQRSPAPLGAHNPSPSLPNRYPLLSVHR
jgi:hypothetical protein